MSDPLSGAVFVQTNDAADNAVVVFPRAEDGSLSRLGAFSTGGRGNGTPHLPSQGSLVPAVNGTRLLVANAGSDDVSVFAVAAAGLSLTDRVPSGGSTPRSVAAHGDLVYVLNAGGDGPGNVSGFRLTDEGAWKRSPVPTGRSAPTRPTARRSPSIRVAPHSSSPSASRTG